MRRQIIGAAICIACLAASAAAQSGCDGGDCSEPHTATITVSGSEQQPSGVWDTNPIAISFNGFTETVSPGQFSTSASIASAFAGKFARNYASVGLSAQVICGTNSSLITFSLATGTFGVVSVTGSTTSFHMTPSGFAQITDSGTITLTVNGTLAATTTYGAGATINTVAAGLAAGVTSSSPVNVTASGSALSLQSKTAGAATDYSYSVQTTSYDSTDFAQPSFVNPPLTGSLSGGANANGSGTSQPIYSSTDTYDGVGNVQSYSDSVMGNWSFVYDSLNRLQTGNSSSGPYGSQHVCWAYDGFGNRTAETIQAGACSASESSVQPNVFYGTSPTNQPSSITNGTAAAYGYSFNPSFNYDAAGDINDDGLNRYLYDAEGRLCAVDNYKIGGAMIGYLYGADGTRVAKGTITAMSCDPTLSGFTTTNDYILGSSDEQVTELAANQGGMSWAHTNIWADGGLFGTYDNIGVHFYFDDSLGTRRAQTDYAGVIEQSCASLPYGNAETCSLTPTEHLFTGKERDSESGNDYFGARYYASSMGRFMSPDSLLGSPDNPQSWNLYSYVQNNPVKNTDPDGHDVSVCSTDSNGNQNCTAPISNQQYQTASQATNAQGILNVPSLNTVGMNGSANITDSNGNVVGTATYVPDSGLDYYAPGNPQAYAQLSAANTVVNTAAAVTAVAYGGVAAAMTVPGAAAAVGRWGLQRLALGASSPALLNLINRLYQAQDEIPGGTAGAVRNEVATGEYINGGHTIKAQDMINALQNLISSGQLSGGDQDIARHVISDLKNSLGH
jgi:RHS repeat-associated protein